jgi:NADH-quinone oxidoreductase subunit M
VHWFIFWELSLVPAYFLIKLWGGPRRVAAANQFFLYTMVGSITLLLAMIAVFLVTGSFDLIALAEKGRSGELASLFSVRLGWYGLSTRALALVIFGGAFLGFAVKVPVWPFHTWLPATYAEAPTGVSMVLTGVMSKMGVYGFLRVLLPIFPEQIRWVLTPLLWLAVATIVFSACAAFAQRDPNAWSPTRPSIISATAFWYLRRGEVRRERAALDDRAGGGAEWRSAAMFNHITAAALFISSA